MTDKYFPPEFGGKSFTCPHCGVHAQQSWWRTDFDLHFDAADCTRCKKFSLWVNEHMVYSDITLAPPAHDRMPEAVKKEYDEAAAVLSKSPPAAAALLRLSIELLLKEINAPGKTINDQIGGLVKQGLKKSIQRALDSVRVIGNEAVHPGMIDLRDTPEVAQAIFRLVNIIVDRMISEDAEIDEINALIPASKQAGITQRDAATKGSGASKPKK